MGTRDEQEPNLVGQQTHVTIPLHLIEPIISAFRLWYDRAAEDRAFGDHQHLEGYIDEPVYEPVTHDLTNRQVFALLDHLLGGEVAITPPNIKRRRSGGAE